MAQRSGSRINPSIVVTGVGHAVVSPASLGEAGAENYPWLRDVQTLDEINVRPWLKSPKTNKFMGKQDRLAVIAAGTAIQSAGLTADQLSENTGLYLAVGYIPFEQTDIDTLVEYSDNNGQFDLSRFSREAINQVNPLLTFRCLPNMPAFHISLNYELRGQYFVCYPDIGQCYVALEEAIAALHGNEVDQVLFGAVADQDNFLVSAYYQRVFQRENAAYPDASAFLCLETKKHAQQRQAVILAELTELTTSYAPPEMASCPAHCNEQISLDEKAYTLQVTQSQGAASMLTALTTVLSQKKPYQRLTHRAQTLAGMSVASEWALHG